MRQVFAGLRVLDFGRFIAAPWCGAIFADLGADVIRIEKREGGEDRWVQPVGPNGAGAGYLINNRGKRAITLDTTTPEGREIAHRLVATADVVLANGGQVHSLQLVEGFSTTGLVERIKHGG